MTMSSSGFTPTGSRFVRTEVAVGITGHVEQEI
jgi:hypothetical protein